ncbi:sperm-tail PG-rich repeat-containing protein 2-like [Centruroides vittatus]|uniref:sperm-tail PG-rich repeat-containing protein 2-like n=1 Tax=Centruroides vittatus TaxID=120091 RepID=UPI00350FEF5C
MLFNEEKRAILQFQEGSTGPLVGPGRYNISRDLGMPEKYKPVEKDISLIDLLREFDPEYKEAKTVKRIKYIFIKTPPKRLIPFNNTCERFPREQSPVKIIPGVGSYNLKREFSEFPNRQHFGFRKGLKDRVEKFKQIAFFTTYPKSPNRCPPTFMYPGPASYDKKPIWKKEDKNIATAPFANRQPRSLFALSRNPGVGRYNVGHALDHITKRKDFHNPLCDGIPFKSTSCRELHKAPPTIDRTTCSFRGPGRYNIRNEDKIRGVLFGNDIRFRKQKNQTPGPGSYKLSTFYDHTVVKKTFNVVAAISTQIRMKKLLSTPNLKVKDSADFEWFDNINPKDPKDPKDPIDIFRVDFVTDQDG